MADTTQERDKILVLKQVYPNLTIEFYEITNDNNNNNHNNNQTNISSLTLKWIKEYKDYLVSDEGESEEDEESDVDEHALEKLEAVWELQHVEELFLSRCPRSRNEDVSSTVCTIGKLANSLKKLTLRYCRELLAHPSEIGSLKNLTHLNIISLGRLRQIPPDICYLTNLEYLSISDSMHIHSIPSEICQLKKLQVLQIKDIFVLLRLPPEIGNLCNLHQLEIYGCTHFGSLPPEIGNLHNLQELNIRRCSVVQTLPSEIGNLSNLLMLEISHCSYFISLSAEIGRLINLHTLKIFDCSRLESLPPEIGNLSSLRHLDICKNEKLQSIPSEMNKLENLYEFQISYFSGFANSLRRLPASLKKLVVKDFDYPSLDIFMQDDSTEGSLTPFLVLPSQPTTITTAAALSSSNALPKEIHHFEISNTFNTSLKCDKRNQDTLRKLFQIHPLLGHFVMDKFECKNIDLDDPYTKRIFTTESLYWMYFNRIGRLSLELKKPSIWSIILEELVKMIRDDFAYTSKIPDTIGASIVYSLVCGPIFQVLLEDESSPLNKKKCFPFENNDQVSPPKKFKVDHD